MSRFSSCRAKLLRPIRGVGEAPRPPPLPHSFPTSLFHLLCSAASVPSLPPLALFTIVNLSPVALISPNTTTAPLHTHTHDHKNPRPRPKHALARHDVAVFVPASEHQYHGRPQPSTTPPTDLVRSLEHWQSIRGEHRAETMPARASLVSPVPRSTSNGELDIFVAHQSSPSLYVGPLP